jgi:hypothetical protein
MKAILFLGLMAAMVIAVTTVGLGSDSALAQMADNATLGNMTGGNMTAGNATDSNSTEAVGGISGIEDPFG